MVVGFQLIERYEDGNQDLCGDDDEYCGRYRQEMKGTVVLRRGGVYGDGLERIGRSHQKGLAIGSFVMVVFAGGFTDMLPSKGDFFTIHSNLTYKKMPF